MRYPVDHMGHELVALGYELISPDGKSLRSSIPIHDAAIMWGNTPDYDTDADACIDILDSLGVGWELAREASNNFYWCSIYIPNAITTNDDVDAVGDTPALAMCNALLEWYKDKNR